MRCRSVIAGIMLSAFIGSYVSWAQTSAGSISIALTTPGTDSPAGFVVVATLSVPDSTDDFSGPRVFAAITDKGGNAAFTDLPFGLYSVCVEPQNSPYVEPCRWAQPDTVYLTSQSPSGSLSLRLRRGVPVDIRIDDPDSLLSQGLDIGLTTPRGYQHLAPVVQDSSGANYRMIVPFSVAAALNVLAASQLQLVDSSGSKFDSASPAAALSFAATDVGKTFQFVLRNRN